MKNEPELGVKQKELADRDAIHIAIIGVVAGEKLHAGQHVGFEKCNGDKENRRVSTDTNMMMGIIDPFLDWPVYEDEFVYLFLYPKSVTSLRHEWTHPLWDETEIKTTQQAEAKAWLEKFAKEVYIDYDEVIAAGHAALKRGDYYIQSGTETARDKMFEGGVKEKFWECFSVVEGVEVNANDREHYVFSCSC